MTIAYSDIVDVSGMPEPQKSRAIRALEDIQSTPEGQALFRDIQRYNREPIPMIPGPYSATAHGGPIMFSENSMLVSGVIDVDNDILLESYQSTLFHELSHRAQDPARVLREREQDVREWCQGLTPEVRQELEQKGLLNLTSLSEFYQRPNTIPIATISSEAYQAIHDYIDHRRVNDWSEMQAIERTNEFTGRYLGEMPRMATHRSTGDYESVARENRANPVLDPNHLYTEIANIELHDLRLREVIDASAGIVWRGVEDADGRRIDRNNNNRLDVRELDRDNNGRFDYIDYVKIMDSIGKLDDAIAYTGNQNLLDSLEEALQSVPRVPQGGGRER